MDRYDVVYKREGVRQLFMIFEPLRGWRHVVIRRQKSAVDWAAVIAEVLEVHYPGATRVRLVMDNLNTHAVGSLYQAFPPERAEGSTSGWRSITRRSTGAGWIWPRSS